jgi:hypothetical protein
VHDDIIEADCPVTLGPACCCPANPVVRVVMPATAVRPHNTELLLCGHHYRVSRRALAAANAAVTELPGPGGKPARRAAVRSSLSPRPGQLTRRACPYDMALIAS